MKKIIALLLFITGNLISYGQCSSVAVQVSSSDTTYVQLYHAGFFNIPSGFANICEWEVTSFSGEILHQETTSGTAFEQGLMLFNHSIAITDSMKVTIVITNNMEGITCTMNDTLYWKEIEVLPGSFIGNWDVLSSNGGVEEDIITSTEAIQNDVNIELFPMPTQDYFTIKSDPAVYAFTIFDANGQLLATFKNISTEVKVDISNYSAGVYFIQFWDSNNRNIGVKRIIKM